MLSKVIEVATLAELDDILADEKDVVVDFAAPEWCVPCQRLAPHYDRASEVVEGVTFVHVDIDQAPEVANHYGIMSVPTVMRHRAGDWELVRGRTVVQLVKELSE